ncbi:MAG: hypothetical protein ACI89J_003888 [Hyphomicrobiaceae bacterium]|jgi:hypothetical protein
MAAILSLKEGERARVLDDVRPRECFSGLADWQAGERLKAACNTAKNEQNIGS